MGYFGHLTHYFHSNICRGITQWPQITEEDILSTFNFSNLDVMNKTIVDNINSVVKENDILYHLGDWSFGGIDKIGMFREQLRCKNIILTLGNHDHHILRNKENVRDYFEDVRDSCPLKDNNIEFGLIHNPNKYVLNKDVKHIVLHGHFHSIGNDRFNSPKLNEKHYDNTKHTFFDVGIIGHPEFRPYSIDEIKSYLNL